MNNILTDVAGTVFDPTIHAATADGTPVTRKSGEFALKRGRKAGYAAHKGVTTRLGVKLDPIRVEYIKELAVMSGTELAEFMALSKSAQNDVLKGTTHYASALAEINAHNAAIDAQRARIESDKRNERIRKHAAALCKLLEKVAPEDYDDVMSLVRFGKTA